MIQAACGASGATKEEEEFPKKEEDTMILHACMHEKKAGQIQDGTAVDSSTGEMAGA